MLFDPPVTSTEVVALKYSSLKAGPSVVIAITPDALAACAAFFLAFCRWLRALLVGCDLRLPRLLGSGVIEIPSPSGGGKRSCSSSASLSVVGRLMGNRSVSHGPCGTLLPH